MKHDQIALKSSQAQSDPFQDGPLTQRVFTLRILGTTDIHQNLVGFDYIRDRPGRHFGLAGLCTLITQARTVAERQGMMCLLLDNGDMLQGAGIERELLRLTVDKTHPMVACLRHLRYDALGIGNHDLDHGLPYLEAMAQAQPTPVICSNLQFSRPSPLQRSVLLQRDIPNAQGKRLHIGVISALPEQTAIWNARELEHHAKVTNAAKAVSKEAARLRAKGADLVILLAHMGVEAQALGSDHRDDARRLAEIPGVDALFLGHTHRRLPGQDHAGYDGIDVENGAMATRPSAMAGYGASDLAVLDLKVAQDDNGTWQVLDHDSRLVPNTDDVAPDRVIKALCMAAHSTTRTSLGLPCGYLRRPLHNFFSLAMPTSTSALTACAKADAVAKGIAGTPEAKLPMLAAVSAHTAGGRGGPDHYLHLPGGAIFKRHLIGLSPFSNGIWGLRVTGQDLRDWLERTATVYSHLDPDAPNTPLLRADRPPFDFDTIYGLSYTIDPTQPAGQRIANLGWRNSPVRPDQEFILATTNFRAVGGGGGKAFGTEQIIYRSTQTPFTALETLLSRNRFRFALGERPWRFACAAPVQAILQLPPDALPYLSDIAHLKPELLGRNRDGFVQAQITLPSLHSAQEPPM